MMADGEGSVGSEEQGDSDVLLMFVGRARTYDNTDFGDPPETDVDCWFSVEGEFQ
jgi:hypothetical protein